MSGSIVSFDILISSTLANGPSHYSGCQNIEGCDNYKWLTITPASNRQLPEFVGSCLLTAAKSHQRLPSLQGDCWTALVAANRKSLMYGAQCMAKQCETLNSVASAGRKQIHTREWSSMRFATNLFIFHSDFTLGMCEILYVMQGMASTA